jgi:prephenate dehydrogenase
MKTVTIIGYGRFGQVLHRLLKDDFSVVVYDVKPVRLAFPGARVARNVAEALESEAVFYAVPIPVFERVFSSHKKYFREGQTLIDVLSVKMHPAKVMRKVLRGTRVQAILTHPMFGPDSSREGFAGLPLTIDRFLSKPATFEFWKRYFEKKKLRVVLMSPQEHDKLAANSQGLTHFIGRLLERLKFKEGPIDSLGVEKLLEVKEQTCNDTWELFAGLQHFNPYTKSMRLRLGAAYDSLYKKLLPKEVKKGVVTFGIQGGKGSFNEQAVREYIKNKHIANSEIAYLYTSERVLRKLHEGDIDFGLFAMHNAQGGIVAESVRAMSRYTFNIVAEQEVLIRHALMKCRDVEKEKLTSVMGHSQNFLQCREMLARKYPHLKQETGKGDLVDTAKAASHVASGKLPKTAAILGPVILAEMYDLDIIEEDLQDLGEKNITNFLLVKR